MDELLYYGRLYDYYKEMLTPKQAATFEDYFFENLTIDEIANNNSVSKNAVSKSIIQTKNELESLEDKLKIKEYVDSLKNEFKDDSEVLSRIEKYDTIIMK